MGGRDHPHVDPDQLAPADAEEFAFGQHPQQPGLQRQRHVADLVQEQGAAVGLFEAPDMPALGAGEGAGLMPEQLAFQQLGRDRRGVERDERFARARGLAMQGVGHQFLAGAGLASHQHRQRGLGQATDGAEQRAHGRARTDQGRADRAGLGAVRVASRQLRRRGIGTRQGACGQGHRVVQVERLGQELMGTAAECTGGAGHVGVGRHHDHGQLWVRLLELVQQHQSVVAGHAHVGEQQVGCAALLQRLQRRGGVLETGHLIAGVAQRSGQHEADRAIVVDHPDARRGERFTGHGVRPPPAAAAG